MPYHSEIDGCAALVAEYDRRWRTRDFDGLAKMWVSSEPEPIYIGDEYPEPLIGSDQINRHWARSGARIREATVQTQIHTVDHLGAGLARCVLLSRWRLRSHGVDEPTAGASWVVWLTVSTQDSARRRIAMHMESEVHVHANDVHRI